MSTWMRVCGLVAAGTAMWAMTNSANAQSCAGLSDLSVTSHSLTTSAAGTDLGRSVAARYGMSGAHLFGGVQTGVDGTAFLSMRSPTVGMDIGYAVKLGASGATQLCPTLQSVYQRGPRGANFGSSSLISTAGLSLGHTIGVTSGFSLVPFAQSGLVHMHRSFAVTSQGADGLGAWGQTNQLFGQVGAGVGLRFGDRLTLTPSYTIPVGEGNRNGVFQQRYSLSASFGIGR